MPIIKSAKKRVRQSQKATRRNHRTKKLLKSAVKSLQTKPSADNYQKAQSAVDSAVKKGVMHKNKAARKKRQLAAAAKASGVKISGKKTTPSVKKTVTKKQAAKKSVAKKPAAKATTKK